MRLWTACKVRTQGPRPADSSPEPGYPWESPFKSCWVVTAVFLQRG